MQYISSDTNVWVDFATIGQLHLPFRLPYIYLMDENTVTDELLSPAGLCEDLIQLGLRTTELTEEEYWLASELNQKYSNPSLYDCIALSIAKCRGIILLSGDKALRKAAKAEGVTVLGTIGVLDQLQNNSKITTEEYLFCLTELKKYNGGKVRLPIKELEKRIRLYSDSY